MIKRFLLNIATSLQHAFLRKRGFRFGKNVVVSRKGIRKIGKGHILCSDNVNINAEVMFVALKDIVIGENSTIAYRALLTTSANPNAPYNRLCRIYKPKNESIIIGNDCWIGAGAILLPGVNIGNGSVVAAGAVVNKDVPENVMVAGCPAVIKKELDPLPNGR